MQYGSSLKVMFPVRNAGVLQDVCMARQNGPWIDDSIGRLMRSHFNIEANKGFAMKRRISGARVRSMFNPTLSAYVGYQPPELVEEGVVSVSI